MMDLKRAGWGFLKKYFNSLKHKKRLGLNNNCDLVNHDFV